MNRNLMVVRSWVALIMILLMGVYVSSLAESYDAGTMRLLRYEGDVEILDPEGQPRIELEDACFASGETLQTGEDGIASVDLTIRNSSPWTPPAEYSLYRMAAI